MAGKEKVSIKRSDQFQEVDEELSRVMEELDMSIERVSAIFDGKSEEDLEELIAAKEDEASEESTPESLEVKEENGDMPSQKDEPAPSAHATVTESKEDAVAPDAG